MSVICQNFVQNAWKKDLCSNCFKSLSDHDASCGAQGRRTSSVNQQVNNTGYISQATTIYQSRGLLNHATWTSLLSERTQDKPNGIFKLENGFHGKHLTISPNGTAEKKPNGTISIPRINGISNGHHHHFNGNNNHAMTNGILKASKSPSGKNRTCNGTTKSRKVNVGFKEGGVQVIGYGGNDYDSDDSDWELGSPDDNEFPLESLDYTDEDRAISRITRENTEFNSKNDNLLQAGLMASCLQQQNKLEEPQRAKNTNGCCRDDVKATENSSSGRKGGVPNGLPVVGRPQLQPAQRREAPPQASVKPMLRDEGQGSNKVVKVEPVKGALELPDLKSKASGEESVEIIHESVIVLVDSTPAVEKEMTSNSVTVTSSSTSHIVTDAKPRPSFLHGTPIREDSPTESFQSAIYTPGKSDLFIPDSRSSSEESSNQASPPLHRRQRSISENDLAQYQSTSVSSAAVSAAATAASSQRGSKPDHAISDSNLAVGRNETLKNADPNSPEKVPTSGGSESKENSPASSPLSETTSRDASSEEPAVYYAVSNTIIHTENTRPTAHVATVQPRSPVCHYAESSVYQEARSVDAGSNRSSPNNRESKLAALAQELEQARHASSQKRQAPSPPKVAETSPPPSTVNVAPVAPVPTCKPDRQENPYGYASIYGKHGNPPSSQFPASPSKSSSGKTKSATISSVQGKKVLALLNLEENTKTSKKGKFSIKKFLKRGKDMESIDTIFQNGSSPNPKAWKQNSDFDRSKLKLEIIHPMDMVGPKEIRSTNPCVSPEGLYASSSPPSLSESSVASGQGGGSVAGDTSPRSEYYSSSDNTCKNSETTSDGIYDDDSTWQAFSAGGNSPLPTSGSSCAGGDLESCGESTPVLSTFSPTGSTGVCLPSETMSSQEPIYGSHRLSSSGKPVRPPKPPPPPRIRPFSPTAGLRTPEEDQPRNSGKPAVPVPKPQVPKRHFRPSSKTDYANLGDVRTLMAPPKPDRSPTSLPPGSKGPFEDENNYEPIDMNQGRACISPQESVEESSYYESYEDIYQEGSSLGSHLDFPIKQQGCSPDSPLQPLWRDSDKVTLTVSSSSQDGGSPPPRGGQGGNSFCGDNSAWLSLEQSYAIVAAANHEILAKLIGQVFQQKLSVLSKGDGQTLCWADFSLQTTHPLRMLGRDKTVFNAFFRQHPSKREVTLVVTSPPNSLSNQESPSKNLFLACFSDSLPAVACAWDSAATGNSGNNSSSSSSEVTQQALVHVLPRAEISSIRSVFLDTQDKQRPVSFEKEFCFVYLQLIQALKILQAHGTEEVDLNLEHLILSKGEKRHISSLILFSSDFADGSKVALCQYALRFMLRLLGIENMDLLSTNDSHPNLSQAARKIFITVAKVLNQEKASSLSKAKNLLEFHLWGPREYIYSLLHGTQGVEDTLQRWLDIERAQSLRLLVRSHKNISAYEEQQLQFLVHTSAKILKDLSSSLCFEKL